VSGLETLLGRALPLFSEIYQRSQADDPKSFTWAGVAENTVTLKKNNLSLSGENPFIIDSSKMRTLFHWYKVRELERELNEMDSEEEKCQMVAEQTGLSLAAMKVLEGSRYGGRTRILPTGRWFKILYHSPSLSHEDDDEQKKKHYSTGSWIIIRGKPRCCFPTQKKIH